MGKDIGSGSMRTVDPATEWYIRIAQKFLAWLEKNNAEQ